MCGRYSLSATAKLVQEIFDVEEIPPFEARWNVAPTQEAPVVRLVDGRRELDLLRWGLVLERAEPPAPGPLLGGTGTGDQDSESGEDTPVRRRVLINARSETALTLPAFRDSFRQRRCLVPADGFYEWAKGARGSARQPFHIRRPDRRPFAMAGLWSRWQGPGTPLESFVVLTCEPTDRVRPLHDRMPVILPEDSWDTWLAGELPPWRLRDLLAPYPGELEVVPVSPFVNKADNEGPECVREVALPPPGPPAPTQRSLF